MTGKKANQINNNILLNGIHWFLWYASGDKWAARFLYNRIDLDIDNKSPQQNNQNMNTCDTEKKNTKFSTTNHWNCDETSAVRKQQPEKKHTPKIYSDN